MITVGIDLAAEPKNTAAAVLRWRNGRARIDQVRAPATDDQLCALVAGADKVGLDCPLGWPIAFRDFIDAQADGGPLAPARTIAERRALAYRVTDRWVAQWHSPLRPLSVSADRIAHAAFRAAGLLRRLDPSVDRTGYGFVAEVYPIGALHRWDIRPRSYKGPAGRVTREYIVDALDGIVQFGFHRALCLDSDHVLDAVIAGLGAAAVHIGRWSYPRAPEQLAAARIEGWIAIPECSLAELSEATRS
ncbi:DUF429 domain-containing protein [uncultured Jatrophihabitans sp.]|uniref:DUF429 domain-containing protein n=1 Tax=uncultured Jatrophihabitans sp. TaxID=1610747 RepID=UPI0035CAFBFD